MLKSFKTLKKMSPAEIAYEKLNGILCVYKPPELDSLEMIRKLKFAFLKGFNELPSRPVEHVVEFNKNLNSVDLVPNKADTIQGYQKKKI